MTSNRRSFLALNLLISTQSFGFKNIALRCQKLIQFLMVQAEPITSREITDYPIKIVVHGTVTVTKQNVNYPEFLTVMQNLSYTDQNVKNVVFNFRIISLFLLAFTSQTRCRAYDATVGPQLKHSRI